MPRVASLFLPSLPIDRIKVETKDGGRHDPAPLVTVHRSGQRMVIAAASPHARSLGLHPGLALAQARAAVPDLLIRDSEPAADTALLHRLALFAARKWSPRSAVSGPDGLWLDLEGVAHLFGGEDRMCIRIVRFCDRLGYRARIAVAGTTGAAHALARNGGEVISSCAAGQEAQAIAPLPVAALRLDERALSAASRFGIETVGELIGMPRGPLARRFGKGLLTRLDQALGRVAEPFEPVIPEETPGATLRLVEPIATAEAIRQVVFDLLDLLVRKLEHQGLGARAVTLLCERVDGEEQRITVGTSRATRDPVHLARLFELKLERIEPGFGIEAMHLVAGRCEPLKPQSIESELSGKTASDPAQLIDRLAGRLGPGHIYRLSSVESDVPERSVKPVSPIQEACGWPVEWPRPVRLLSPPERVENVLAELPDQPPLRFRWRGRMHVVRKADGPERIFGEWWKRTAEAEAVRDYFQVEDESGARFWLFRRGDGLDGRTGDLSWYMHGIFA